MINRLHFCKDLNGLELVIVAGLDNNGNTYIRISPDGIIWTERVFLENKKYKEKHNYDK